MRKSSEPQCVQKFHGSLCARRLWRKGCCQENVIQNSTVREEIVALEGQLVRIRGYMLPSFQQSGIKKFVLVRDNMECCYGPGAALYDCVIIEMQGSASAEFTVRPMAVEGVFKVSEFKGPDGKHLAIYHIDGRSAK